MPNWNAAFTRLLRDRHPRMWGNWSLSADVRLGAVGVIADGVFLPVGCLDGVTADIVPCTDGWRFGTSAVKRSVVNLGAGGGNSAVGDGELTVNWSFDDERQQISEFNVASRETIRNLPSVIAANSANLKSLAESVGMRTAGSIDQGFGFVSGIVWARSGANVAALSKASKFVLGGRASLVGSLLGSSGSNLGVSGSYSRVEEHGSFDLHLWPSSPEATATGNVPVAFTFSSFEGDTHLPCWTSYLQNIVIEVRNVGSYIATVTVRYVSAGGKTEESYSGISGGLSRQIILPLDATELDIVATFVASSDRHERRVEAPLLQSESGKLRFRVGGLWPSGPRFDLDW